MTALKTGRFALQLFIAMMLGACAGGGGGGGGAALPPPPPAPSPPASPPPPLVPVPPVPPPAAVGSFPSSTSAEYTNNWGVEGVNADAAWQYQNAHGEGVLIGIIDDGMVAPTDPHYAELQGRIDPDSIDIRTTRNQLSSSNTHGAELASLIAGNDNGDLTVGVAYEATLLAVRADNGAGTFDTNELADAVDYAVAQGVDIINISLGSGNTTGAAMQAAIQRATAAGVIFTVSAGNDGNAGATQPNYPGFLASDPAVANGLIIIAGGLNRDGSFNTVSNPAGNLANTYLVAPGWEIIVPDFGAPGPLAGFQRCSSTLATSGPCASGMVQIQGTSYASPLTAGAAAVLMSAFPGLTPTQVVQILLQSTDDIGAAGVDAQTGRGRLNLARAFQPIGTVASPLLVGAPSIGPDTPLGAMGAAFGDGFTDDVGEWRTVGFDNFGRTYAVDFGGSWRRAVGGPALAAQAPQLWQSSTSASGARMSFAPPEFLAPDSVRLPVNREDLQQPSVRIDAPIAGFNLSFAAYGGNVRDVETSNSVGHLAFVQSDTSLRLTRPLTEHLSVSLLSENGAARVGLSQERVTRTATAAQATFAFQGGAISATYGRMNEGEGLLGLVWVDRFGETPGGQTRFAGVSGNWSPLAGLRFGFNAETGAANFADRGWLWADAPLRTTAFSAEAAYALVPAWLERDGVGSLVFTLSQPLRVEDGVLSASLPTATNYGRRSLSYETRAIDVTPSGREMRFGLGYRYVSGDLFSAFGEIVYVTEPGHVASAEPEGVLRFGLRARR